MLINTHRFGEVEVDETKKLSFPDGLPGFEDKKQFVVLQFEESYPIFWLQSTEDPEVCLPVIDTFRILPEYAFDIGDDDISKLEISSPEDIHVMSVVVIPEAIEQMTVNLAAPIVVNIRTGRSAQIILGGTEYNVRFPIFSQVYNLLKEEDANAGTIEEN